MIVSYSSLNRFEIPKLTLCNPGSKYNPEYGADGSLLDGALTNIVGILTDISDMEIVFNFNSTSELNFRISYIRRDNANDNKHIYALYKAVQNRRLVFVDNIGYFMITNIDDGYDGTCQYKDVTAQSIDIEIQQKMIPYIADGTYRFSTDKTSGVEGLLEAIVKTLPLWTIGNVDTTIAERFRTFEDVDTSLNCLGFMLENMQDAYECIFIFDPISRTINVYDQNDYVRKTNIHITKNDVINSLNVTENADDLYTALTATGDDNVTISAINPLGANTIYNFNYYLDWMTSELREKVVSWQDAVKENESTYYNLNLQYYEALENASNYRLEIQKLDQQIEMYQRCRNNIVAESDTSRVASYNAVISDNGGTVIEIKDEINETLQGIDDLIAICQNQRATKVAALDKINETIETQRSAIEDIHEALALNNKNNFSESELEELTNYIFEGSYSDEYVTITDIMSYKEKFEQMKTLYDRAQTRLARVSQPTQEFNIDVENFVFAKEFANWSEQLETGCLINVELEQDNIAELFLSGITINYEDKSLNMTFGNRFNKFDPKSLFDNVLGDISKSANTLGYIKEILYPIKSGEFNNMKEALETSRNLSMGAALSSDNQEVIIDSSGYTGRKLLDSGEYDPKQVKITGKNLVFTDDAWETCKVAIGELPLTGGDSDKDYAYGINAEAIIGDIIVGNGLRILNSEGEDAFKVTEDSITSKISEVNDAVEKAERKITTLQQTASDLTIKVSKEVDHVTTKNKRYTFNDEGLTISSDEGKTKTQLTENGMTVSRSGENGEDVLIADDDGVNAMNLTARQYLIVGSNSRFEDYADNGSTRTGCFYIGA